MLAEMQTPSQSSPLTLFSPVPEDGRKALEPGMSLQKIIRHDLKEEGNHVLAVSVSYTETTQGEGGATASSGKLRTFRKLYQFVAQPCLSVRTKTTEFPPIEIEDKAFGPYGKSRLVRYVLEAQLENVGEGAIVLGQTRLEARPPFRSTSLNWDMTTSGGREAEFPRLHPRGVEQLAFLVEQERGVTEGVEGLQKDLKRDGRAVLGQLSIEWWSAMGDRGFLSTGNLMSRRKAG